jgi:hypothetical protein
MVAIIRGWRKPEIEQVLMVTEEDSVMSGGRHLLTQQMFNKS